jgi:hypothetical protein
MSFYTIFVRLTDVVKLTNSSFKIACYLHTKVFCYTCFARGAKRKTGCSFSCRRQKVLIKRKVYDSTTRHRNEKQDN